MITSISDRMRSKQKYDSKDKYYEKSVYQIVKDFIPSLETWDIDQVKVRCTTQLKTISTEIINMDIN